MSEIFSKERPLSLLHECIYHPEEHPLFTTEPSGCRVIHPDHSGFSRDVWEAIPRPSDWFIAVVGRAMKEKTAGGIMLPKSTQDDAETVNYIGRVLAMGPSCFKRENFMVVENSDGELHRVLPEPRCNIGDWIIFRRHQQIIIPVLPIDAKSSEDKVMIRFTDDASILAVAPKPEQLKVYIA